MSKKYYKMEVYGEEYPSCCGIQVFTGLYADEAGSEAEEKPKKASWMSDWDYKRQLEGWKQNRPVTKEELFKDFLKRVSDERYARHVQIAFVKRHKGQKKGDVPDGFRQFLEENGWYCIDEFVNPNHGNLLCVMGKTFREKKIKKVSRNLFGY